MKNDKHMRISCLCFVSPPCVLSDVYLYKYSVLNTESETLSHVIFQENVLLLTEICVTLVKEFEGIHS